MDFNEALGQFVCEYDGLIFTWEEEPDEAIQNVMKKLADNYYARLDAIIAFMLPDIVTIYENVSADDVKKNLGKPMIDYNSRQVTYVEQSFDDVHIFSFEFLDDAFEDLEYFSVDG